MAPSSSAAAPAPSGSKATGSGKQPSRSQAHVDPILRNTLRYTVSAKDYALLHKYLISKSPTVVRKAPTVERYEEIVKPRTSHDGTPGDDYNAAAVRVALRAFLASQVGLKAWDVIKTKILNRGKNVV
jgi:hypothetical protein